MSFSTNEFTFLKISGQGCDSSGFGRHGPMTRFTRCESSQPSPVIVVRSAPPCHRIAPEKAPRKVRSEPPKGTGRPPQGLQMGRGKGARRVSSSLRPPPPLSLSFLLFFFAHHLETLVVPWSPNAPAAQRGVNDSVLAKHERLTVAMALAETLQPQRAKRGGARVPILDGTVTPVPNTNLDVQPVSQDSSEKLVMVWNPHQHTALCQGQLHQLPRWDCSTESTESPSTTHQRLVTRRLQQIFTHAAYFQTPKRAQALHSKSLGLFGPTQLECGAIAAIPTCCFLWFATSTCCNLSFVSTVPH